MEKHCDNCKDSFYRMEKNHYVEGGVRMQYCRNPVYNSADYTHEMLMEDWDNGYCRLWSPRIEKGCTK